MKIKNFSKQLLKRSISLIIIITIIASMGLVSTSALSYSGSSSYKSGKYYAALSKVSLTGNQRTDIVNVAKSQIGYQEGGSSSQLSGEVRGNNNYTEYGRWYGVQDMWCAMFVSWCANVAGVSTSIVPKHAYTPTGLSWFKNKGQAYSRATVAAGGYTPQAGDIIYFKSSRNSAETNHIGIVTSYSGGTVYTIEGNTSSATISTNGGAVAAKSYSISNTYIVYICKPSYNTSIKNGWVESPSGSDTWYYYNNGNMLKGVWKSYNNAWYYLNSDGTMAKGWKQVNDYWYYFLPSNVDGQPIGSMVKGWYNINDRWYYFYPGQSDSNPEGSMATGQVKVSDKWYYLYTDADVKADKSGKTVLGAMATGWVKINGNWLYMYTEADVAANDSLVLGEMATGWVKVSGKWYYLYTNADVEADKSGKTILGATATGWIELDGDWYYLYKDEDVAADESGNTILGAMATGWFEDGDKWYYLDGSGVMLTGFAIFDYGTYYFYPTTSGTNYKGAMAIGDVIIGDVTYTFNETGKYVANSSGTNVAFFPACASSEVSIIDALRSINVDSSNVSRSKIALANGIDNYTGTAEQNTKLLTLLKAGKLINAESALPPSTEPTEPIEPTEPTKPTEPIEPTKPTKPTEPTKPSTTIPTTEPTEPPTTVPTVYFPACDPSYTTISSALTSIGVDSSKAYRTKIAAVNNIENYTGTAAQNTKMLELLIAGKLINPDSSYVPSETQPTTQPTTKDYSNYTPNCYGDGAGIYANGVDVSRWQEDGVNYYELKDAGIDFVIMRVGYRHSEDPYFEYNYNAAKEAGLDVGAYWYSYATTTEEALVEAEYCAKFLGDKRFEYPIYFDFEDPTQLSLPTDTKKAICNTWMKNIADRGYLVGLYSSYTEFTSDLNPAKIAPGYESWMARYFNSGLYDSYKDNGYDKTYGMWQYTSTGVVKGYAGNIDRSIVFKDYPSIVKQNGYNNYSKCSLDDFEIANLGDNFYGLISNKNLSLTADLSNITVSDTASDAKQMWKFILQSDESYKIVNAFSKKTLCVTDSGELTTSEISDTDNQNFYIIKNSDQTFSFMPASKVTEGKVIDIKSDNSVVLSSVFSSGNSKFSIADISKYKLGDVNLDGVIDVSDVTALQRILVNADEFNNDNKIICDVNFDNKVDVLDVTIIQKLLVGLITEF